VETKYDCAYRKDLLKKLHPESLLSCRELSKKKIFKLAFLNQKKKSIPEENGNNSRKAPIQGHPDTTFAACLSDL
jgi:hypothetical protein